jgi:hypothetical protein
VVAWVGVHCISFGKWRNQGRRRERASYVGNLDLHMSNPTPALLLSLGTIGYKRVPVLIVYRDLISHF